MEDARWMRPPFRHFGCSGVLGLRRPADSGPNVCRMWEGTVWASRSVPGSEGWLYCQRRQRGGPESGVGPRQAYMSKFAGAT